MHLLPNHIDDYFITFISTIGGLWSMRLLWWSVRAWFLKGSRSKTNPAVLEEKEEKAKWF